MMSFWEARRRFDEHYWSQLYESSGRNLSRTAHSAGVTRASARYYLEILGIRTRPDVRAPTVSSLVAELGRPTSVALLGYRIDHEKVAALTADQKVAAMRWAQALNEARMSYDKVVPWFLLMTEADDAD